MENGEDVYLRLGVLAGFWLGLLAVLFLSRSRNDEWIVDPMHMFPQLITFFFFDGIQMKIKYLTIVNALMVPSSVIVRVHE